MKLFWPQDVGARMQKEFRHKYEGKSSDQEPKLSLSGYMCKSADWNWEEYVIHIKKTCPILLLDSRWQTIKLIVPLPNP
jgi:hypothetical protein